MMYYKWRVTCAISTKFMMYAYNISKKCELLSTLSITYIYLQILFYFV